MKINNQIEIKFLADCHEHIPTLAMLWYEELAKRWAPDASIAKAIDRLTSHLNKDKLPMAIVALLNGQPVGMACLRETDGIRPGATPWLGSLVVKPECRACGIGETLIEEIKSQAKLLGHSILYLLAFDPTIPSWYARLGWQPIGDDELLGHRVAVMRLPL